MIKFRFMKLLSKVFLGFASLSMLGLIAVSPIKADDSTVCSATETLQIMDVDTCNVLVELFSAANNPNQGPWYNQNPRQFATKVLDATNPDEIFGERYTYAQINWIVNSIATMLNPAANLDSATSLIQLLQAISGIMQQLSMNQQPSMAEYAKLGVGGTFAGVMNSIYANPPASGVKEIKSIASRVFDLGTGTQSVNAQGYGFTGLTSGGSIQKLWTASRNMSYLIIVILLIASGFLVMFRVKVNPQTVISIQYMIPKLIITVLLVTFSFAIAGLVIDLIYVFIAGFAGFLSLGGIINNGQLAETINTLTNRSFPFYIWLQIPLTLISLVLLPIILGAAGLILGSPFVVSAPVLGGLGLVIGLLIPILLSIWSLIILAKIFIMMIKAYVMLLLQIAIGPLQIMLDLIPGQHGFGPWIRNLIANASVFVTIPILLVIQHYIAGNFFSGFWLNLTTFQNQGGVNLNLPFLGAKLQHGDIFITWFVGFTIFSMTPKIADMIRDAMKIPPFKYGAATNEALGNLKAGALAPARWFAGANETYFNAAAKQPGLSTEEAAALMGAAQLSGRAKKAFDK